MSYGINGILEYWNMVPEAFLQNYIGLNYFYLIINNLGYFKRKRQKK